MKKKIVVDIWEQWTKNWENAKKFFESKGNMKTKSRLKAKWYRDFAKSITWTIK